MFILQTKEGNEGVCNDGKTHQSPGHRFFLSVIPSSTARTLLDSLDQQEPTEHAGSVHRLANNDKQKRQWKARKAPLITGNSTAVSITVLKMRT